MDSQIIFDVMLVVWTIWATISIVGILRVLAKKGFFE